MFCFSNVTNNRGLSNNAFLPSQLDSISQSDNGIEQSQSPSMILKQRAIMNNRLSNNPIIHQSNSINGMTTSSINPVYEYLNNSSLTSMKQTRSLFEGVSDENNDDILDDQQQYDRSSSTGDRQSMSLSEKTRKQIFSARIFKPFQNIRFRKKNTNS